MVIILINVPAFFNAYLCMSKIKFTYNKNNFLLFLEPKHNKYGIIKIYKIKIIKIAYNKFICINTLRRTLKFLDLKL